MVQMSCFIYAVFQVCVMVTFGVIKRQSRTLQNGIGLPDLREGVRAVVPNPLCATDRFNVRQYFHAVSFLLILLAYGWANFSGSVSRDRDKRLDMRQE